jgi:valyl-tRNA synthetase
VKVTAVGVKALVRRDTPAHARAARRESVCFLAKLDVDRGGARRAARAWRPQYDPAFELYVDLGRYIDLKVELERLDKELGKTEKDLAATDKTLSNPDFATRAPPEKVEAAHARKAELTERLGKLAATKAELAGLVP